MDCRDHHDYSHRIGMVKSFSTNRLIGHPEDVWRNLISVDDNLRAGDVPWGLSLERNAIGERLLAALERHAEGAPWNHQERYQFWYPDTQGRYEDPAYVGVYRHLYNVINPANYHYAEDGNNYRQGYYDIVIYVVMDVLRTSTRRPTNGGSTTGCQKGRFFMRRPPRERSSSTFDHLCTRSHCQ